MIKPAAVKMKGISLSTNFMLNKVSLGWDKITLLNNIFAKACSDNSLYDGAELGSSLGSYDGLDNSSDGSADDSAELGSIILGSSIGSYDGAANGTTLTLHLVQMMMLMMV